MLVDKGYSALSRVVLTGAASAALSTAEACVAVAQLPDPTLSPAFRKEADLQSGVAEAAARLSRAVQVLCNVEGACAAMPNSEEILRAFEEAKAEKFAAEALLAAAAQGLQTFRAQTKNLPSAQLGELASSLVRFKNDGLYQPGQRCWDAWEMHRTAQRLLDEVRVADGYVLDCSDKIAERDAAKLALAKLTAAAQDSSAPSIEMALAAAQRAFEQSEAEIRANDARLLQAPSLVQLLSKLVGELRALHVACENMDRVVRGESPLPLRPGSPARHA